MNQPRDGHGQFAPKLGEEKKLRSLRLTDTAWNKLQEKADRLAVTKTDIIEQLAREENQQQVIIDKSRAPYVLAVLERFIEYRCSEYGKNNAQKGEFSTDGSRWYYLNEFKKWIESE